MSAVTKITLSDKELSLVTDAGWILTKQLITAKVYDMFAGVIPGIRSSLLHDDAALPAEVISSVPKISKGENYLQLPYVMLDYPRCFKGEDIFAVRTMFWWGNFFSITLHVSGKYVEKIKQHIFKNKMSLDKDIFIGVNENQWEHHFEENNFLPYRLLDERTQREIFETNDFIKLALKFDLHHWNRMPELLNEGYQKIAALIF